MPRKCPICIDPDKETYERMYFMDKKSGTVIWRKAREDGKNYSRRQWYNHFDHMRKVIEARERSDKVASEFVTSKLEKTKEILSRIETHFTILDKALEPYAKDPTILRDAEKQEMDNVLRLMTETRLSLGLLKDILKDLDIKREAKEEDIKKRLIAAMKDLPVETINAIMRNMDWQ